MTLLGAIILGLLIGASVAFAWALVTAPEGWEDERGFHRGRRE